jgi:acyl-CoA thioesterase 8
VIAQCLAAGQHTVSKEFYVHSMHCYFVMAGNANIPIIYHVEHVREGRSYAVRTVQARQRGRVIFTTTMSFVKENSGGTHLVEHAYDMPLVAGPKEDQLHLPVGQQPGHQSPFESQQIDIFNNDSPRPHTKRTRQWIKARGTISDAGGHEAHLAALAYMSDSYFIGTISRVHKLWRIPRPVPREQKDRAPWEEGQASSGSKTPPRKPDIVEDEDVLATIRHAGPEKMRQLAEKKKIFPQVGMMVSLDHTIYFHNPKDFKADEWLFTEMESPWAGDGRGLVMQRIWTRSGKLVASCVQEVSLASTPRRTKRGLILIGCCATKAR